MKRRQLGAVDNDPGPLAPRHWWRSHAQRPGCGRHPGKSIPAPENGNPPALGNAACGRVSPSRSSGEESHLFPAIPPVRRTAGAQGAQDVRQRPGPGLRSLAAGPPHRRQRLATNPGSGEFLGEALRVVTADTGDRNGVMDRQCRGPDKRPCLHPTPPLEGLTAPIFRSADHGVAAPPMPSAAPRSIAPPVRRYRRRSALRRR